MKTETGKTRTGFHLEGGAVVLCRRMKDGWWEAWIEVSGSPVERNPDGGPLSFFGPSRFKAQCKATRWYAEKVHQFSVCA
ncbi:MAG: hypothetical protein KC800_17950 [Candidatus Eremiobacteraeota bacterium]|nr:hypothetical protein [Candidatus Eremiobacteraeota bacterium]